jgi:protein involved in polysaccharide export with SLBB domain
LYEKGLTVHKAISLAGGRTEKAERGALKLTRLSSGVAETITATPEMVVVPDDIIVVEADNHKFYVSGEVKNPSSYPYKERLTVHKAIAMAGGLTDKAERAKFQVLRQIDSHEQTLPVELDSVLLPDDIIVVAEAQRVYVSGEVKTPGRYMYEKGLTVHKAISLAGGWTDKAERGPVKVTRVVEGVAETKVATPELTVLPDDIIVAEPGNYKLYVSGEVKNPSSYPYKEGLTVHKAIAMAGGFTDKASISGTKVLRTINGQQRSIQTDLDAVLLPEDLIVVPRSFF